VQLHVVPGSSRAGIEGTHGERLKVKVRARPTEGAANDELLRLLATALGIARAKVELVSGASSRRKTVRVPGEVESRLRRLVC
jgi:uncharacterized protein (TIGR00251 family)